MTLRTMEKFSTIIINRRNVEPDSFDLRELAPIMNPIHPKMIKAQLSFEDNPQQEPVFPTFPGKYYACYATLKEAQNDYPGLKIVKGLPFAVFENQNSSAIFDFSPFGMVIISPDSLDKDGPPGIHQHLLPPFLEYALSQELWGPQGKWMRFHERLHTLFDKYKLLQSSVPGRYVLKPEAHKLEKRAIKGTLKDNSYVLTFPWTFPLSALVKLEEIIQEEF